MADMDQEARIIPDDELQMVSGGVKNTAFPDRCDFCRMSLRGASWETHMRELHPEKIAPGYLDGNTIDCWVCGRKFNLNDDEAFGRHCNWHYGFII